MDLPPAIETRGLSKRYKSAHALRGLDLRVPAGSIYGLVGRNGAGKMLDEPTEGLDPILVERVLQALVRAVADNPVLTVFFSSHRLFEVDRIADRVGILHDGRLLFDDSLDELKTAYKRVVATFDDAPPDALRTLDGVRHARAEGRMIALLASRHVDEIVAESRARGARQVDVFPVSLNDIFLDAVGDRVD